MRRGSDVVIPTDAVAVGMSDGEAAVVISLITNIVRVVSTMTDLLPSSALCSQIQRLEKSTGWQTARQEAYGSARLLVRPSKVVLNILRISPKRSLYTPAMAMIIQKIFRGDVLMAVLTLPSPPITTRFRSIFGTACCTVAAAPPREDIHSRVWSALPSG